MIAGALSWGPLKLSSVSFWDSSSSSLLMSSIKAFSASLSYWLFSSNCLNSLISFSLLWRVFISSNSSSSSLNSCETSLAFCWSDQNSCLFCSVSILAILCFLAGKSKRVGQFPEPLREVFDFLLDFFCFHVSVGYLITSGKDKVTFEPPVRFELTAYALRMRCSTSELRWLLVLNSISYCKKQCILSPSFLSASIFADEFCLVNDVIFHCIFYLLFTDAFI